MRTPTLSAVGSTTSSYGELRSISYRRENTDLLALDLTRDDLGRVKTMVEAEDGETHAYGYVYDPGGRLTEVTRDGRPWRAYGYDANGNRTSDRSAEQLPVTSTYDAQDRLLERGGVQYKYTAAGELSERLAGDASTRFAYDGFGQLKRVELPGGKTIGYLTDGLGRRIGRTENGALAGGWLYGEGPGPIAAVDAGGVVRAQFVYGARPQVPEYMERGGRRYRFITDAVGSVRKVIDTTSGEVVQELEYDPFGRVLSDTRPGFQPFGFAGGLTDPDTGLVRFGARDYDPETGCWTSKDPIGFAGGDTNLYGYVLNDPVNLVDPEGLASLPSAQDLGQATVAFFDEASLGLSREVRQLIGNDRNVDYCSTAYKFGANAGGLYPTGRGKSAVNGVRAAAKGGSKLVEGARYPLSPKVQGQLGKRGWTTEAIDEAVQSGKQVRAVNKATGNAATRYIHRSNGQSVVIDDVTGQVIHVGGPGFKYGPASGDVP